MFVIKRTKDGAYVSKPSNQSSYTYNLANARKWNTREGAQAELCAGNEYIVDLERELDRLRR